MKKLFIITVVIFIQINLFSQQIKERHFEEIGKFEKIKISLITIKSPNQVKVERFLQFKLKLVEKEDKIKLLNLIQVIDLIKSIECIKGNLSKNAPKDYIEVYCENNTGLEIGIYPYGRTTKYWEAYLTIDKTESKFRITFLPEDFNKLLSLLEKAKEMMK